MHKLLHTEQSKYVITLQLFFQYNATQIYVRKAQLNKKPDNLELFYTYHILGNELLNGNTNRMFVTVSRAFCLWEQAESRYLETQHFSLPLAHHDKGSHHVVMQRGKDCPCAHHEGTWGSGSIAPLAP
jgi:hypothetical protein